MPRTTYKQSILIHNARATTLFVLMMTCAFLMHGCSSSAHQKNYHNNGKPIQNVSADFRVGGFFGTTYVVKIKDNVLSYRTYKQGVTSEWQKQTLSAEDIEKLESKFIELDVVNWDKQYINPNIMDGTNWFIQYSSKRIKIKSRGKNKYPDSYKSIMTYLSKELLKGKPFA
jgi:hypothetical protein